MTSERDSLDEEAARFAARVKKLDVPDQLAVMDLVKQMAAGHFNGWKDRFVKGWFTKRVNRYRAIRRLTSTIS